jgi:hypothetical protein
VDLAGVEAITDRYFIHYLISGSCQCIACPYRELDLGAPATILQLLSAFFDNQKLSRSIIEWARQWSSGQALTKIEPPYTASLFDLLKGAGH